MHTTKRRILVILGVSVLMTIFVLVMIHELESSLWLKADTIRAGMTKANVLQIMGEPKSISKTPEWHATEEWHYDGPRKFPVNFSLRPLRVLVSKPDDWITIGFTNERVFSVWIPSIE